MFLQDVGNIHAGLVNAGLGIAGLNNAGLDNAGHDQPFWVLAKPPRVNGSGVDQNSLKIFCFVAIDGKD